MSSCDQIQKRTPVGTANLRVANPMINACLLGCLCPLPRTIRPHVRGDEGVLLLRDVRAAAESGEDEQDQGDAQEHKAEDRGEIGDHELFSFSSVRRTMRVQL